MSDKNLPLVSVVIPAFNRPHFLEKAIISVLAQTYKNIEIIICDDSTNNKVQTMIDPYLKKYPQLKYHKNETTLFLDNWNKCFELATGEFINYLMDDDVFHKQKIEKMLKYFLQDEDITLVTSSRKLIDQYGNMIPSFKTTLPLFNETKILDGIYLGNHMLTHGINVVGEGTTVLFRKKDLTEQFGTYKKKQYCCINDVATWLSLLAKGKAVYISEELSYFRIHSNQNSRSKTIVSTSVHEWLDLIIDSRKDGFLESLDLYKSALYNQQYKISNFSLPNYASFHRKKREVLHRIHLELASLQ